MGAYMRTAIQTSDGQACMSMLGDSPEYEYRRRLRERQRRGAIGFHALAVRCLHMQVWSTIPDGDYSR